LNASLEDLNRFERLVTWWTQNQDFHQKCMFWERVFCTCAISRICHLTLLMLVGRMDLDNSWVMCRSDMDHPRNLYCDNLIRFRWYQWYQSWHGWIWCQVGLSYVST
jgi:hypothetical protein